MKQRARIAGFAAPNQCVGRYVPMTGDELPVHITLEAAQE